MGVPLYVMCCCSLVAFNVLPLTLVFVILVATYLGLFLFVFDLYGTPCSS